MKKLIYTAILLQLSISSLLLADPVYFADPNLKLAVEAELGIDDPNQTDMLGMTYLSANSSGIFDLTGLEYATDVNELHLSSNLISVLSPISALTSLINLYLNNNQITNISAVENLVNLDTLFLSINLIYDLSPVSGLTGLTSLYLGNNEIINISSLSGLSNLTMLDLTNNQVDDISAVSNLTSLELLSLTNNQVVDISAMSNLTSLQYLYLTNNQIIDISVLAGEEPNDLISLLLTQNPLNKVAYCTYLPIIEGNNPLISIEVDDNPYTCLLHDICSNAIAIVEKDKTYNGSSNGATGTEESICGRYDELDVWHSYTPDSNEVVDISLCTSQMDTTLVVYDFCGGTELACNDDYCGSQGYQSQVTIGLTAGETYLIRVAEYWGGTGNYKLTITDAPEPPVNNTCQDAIEVVQYSPPVTGSTTTAYGTDITSCTTSDTRDVWYYFIPTISGRYLIDPNAPNGSDYDTSLAVFDDCGGTELACNDDYTDYDDRWGYPDVVTSRIIVSLVEGETYYIRISGSGGAAGNYSLTVTLASDINKDGVVDIIDLSWLVQEWLQDGTSDADIAPEGADGGGDLFIDFLDFAEFCRQY